MGVFSDAMGRDKVIDLESVKTRLGIARGAWSSARRYRNCSWAFPIHRRRSIGFPSWRRRKNSIAASSCRHL